MLRLLGAPALALTVMTAAAPAAQAAHRYHHAGYRASFGYRHQFAHTGSHHQRFAHYRHRYFTGATRVASFGGGHVRGGRPSAWCGWYARSLVGHDPGAQYNLARNWAHWGRATRPHVGAMVVWAHHVGMITGQTSDGRWIVKSGNDGHAVRERPRSIRGAIAFRES